MPDVNATLVESARNIDCVAVRAATRRESTVGDIMVLRQYPSRRRARPVPVEHVAAALSVLEPLLETELKGFLLLLVLLVLLVGVEAAGKQAGRTK